MADTRSILVYYDGEQVDTPRLMGVLSCDHIRGKEIFSFEFDRSWLSDKRFRSFDPDLQMFGGKQYVPQEKDNFGIFLDSTPDRWGHLDSRPTPQVNSLIMIRNRTWSKTHSDTDKAVVRNYLTTALS